MKKLFILVCAISALTLSGCSTKCTCVTKINGEVFSETVVEDVKGKCSEANSKTTVGELVTEISCK